MTHTLLAFLVAANPAAALVALGHDRRTDRPIPVAAGALVALGILAVLAGASASILEALEITQPTFQVGAGAVVTAAGLRWFVLGPPRSAMEPETDLRYGGYVCFPTLLTPGAAALAVSVGARDGALDVVAAAAVAVVLGAVAVYRRRRIPHALGTALVRLLGGAAMVVGVGIIVDGIRTL